MRIHFDITMLGHVMDVTFERESAVDSLVERSDDIDEYDMDMMVRPDPTYRLGFQPQAEAEKT